MQLGKISRTTYVLSLLIVFFLPPALFAGLGVQLHTVTTGSMRPAIQPGAVVLTKLVKAEDIKKGHVILYFDTQTDNPVSHRVIAVTHLGNQVSITTKGDANAKADPTILEPNSVPIATVIGVLPGVGFIVSALHSTVAKVGLGFLIAILFALSFFYERHRKTLRSQNKESVEEEIAAIEPESPDKDEVPVDAEFTEVEAAFEEEPKEIASEVHEENLEDHIEQKAEEIADRVEPSEVDEVEEVDEVVVQEHSHNFGPMIEVQTSIPEEFWISEPTSSELKNDRQLAAISLDQAAVDVELERLEAEFQEQAIFSHEVDKAKKKKKKDKEAKKELKEKKEKKKKKEKKGKGKKRK